MGSFKEQFVVDLENHFRMKIFFRELAVDCNHRDFDQVGRGALKRRVERGSFGEVSQGGLRRGNFGYGPDTPEQRSRDAGFARFGERFFEIRFYPVIAREVRSYKFRGFFLVDAQLRREAERRLSINNAEINGLGRSAMLGVLRQWTHAENFLRRARVDVLSSAKRFDQHRILRKMRED